MPSSHFGQPKAGFPCMHRSQQADFLFAPIALLLPRLPHSPSTEVAALRCASPRRLPWLPRSDGGAPAIDGHVAIGCRSPGTSKKCNARPAKRGTRHGAEPRDSPSGVADE
ncbi:hypothetical protein HPB48_007124 [Haemaphysalis longicornis]|uniref:Uncharacterized protein n=1 Tax=Haemaphysalis longicornis TaxID=44386 RepID=A0A9J6G2I8_HAELO|nr:hypothetical protein HPB48_007124 [Haemaphysalis longicornis]